MYQQHKLNFFEQIYYSVCKPMKYYRLTKVSGGRLTGFVFLFAFMISLFSIIPMLYAILGPGGLSYYLRSELPQFELTNGKLYVDERVEETEANTYILIDTSIDSFSIDDIDKSYDQVVLISQTNIINYQSYGRTQELDFANLNGMHFDNSIINELMPFLYLLLVLVAIIIYLFTVGAYYVSALCYSLIGLITSAAAHANLTYATIFKTAVYSKVTISILYAILDVTPLTLPGSLRFGIGVIVTVAYVVYGTLSHTSSQAYEEAGMVPPGSYQQ